MNLLLPWRTNSCIRQHSSEINIRISQFTAEYVKISEDIWAAIAIFQTFILQAFGYMYLADNETFAQHLRANQKLQASLGAEQRSFLPGDSLCLSLL